MPGPERRRAERHPVDLSGVLFLSDARTVAVRIKDIGTLGAFVQIGDLEEPIFEAERFVLEHPSLQSDGRPIKPAAPGRTRSVGSVVRVDLEFLEEGVTRQLALYFDGGTPPDGYATP